MNERRPGRESLRPTNEVGICFSQQQYVKDSDWVERPYGDGFYFPVRRLIAPVAPRIRPPAGFIFPLRPRRFESR